MFCVPAPMVIVSVSLDRYCGAKIERTTETIVKIEDIIIGR